MPIDARHFRPITFQGVLFPATLMGISILEPVLAVDDEPDLNEWLWRFPICCGVEKSDDPERCARCAERAMNLILARRDDVLAGIRERLGPHGFDPTTTIADWLTSLEQIVALSRAARDACFWSAPQHPQDPFKSRADAERFLAMASAESSSLLTWLFISASLIAPSYVFLFTGFHDVQITTSEIEQILVMLLVGAVVGCILGFRVHPRSQMAGAAVFGAPFLTTLTWLLLFGGYDIAVHQESVFNVLQVFFMGSVPLLFFAIPTTGFVRAIHWFRDRRS